MNDINDVHLRNVTNKLASLCLNTIWRNMEVWRRVKNNKNLAVLDVGCGRQGFLSGIISKYKTVGVDIWKPNVMEIREVYWDAVIGDARMLPFKDKSCDIAMAIELIEHLDKADGGKALEEMERVAKKMVVIAMPIGENEHHDYYGNPFEEHKYVWSLNEIKEKGYEVRGEGIKGLMSGDSWWTSLPKFMRPLQYIAYIIGTLFSYHIPQIAEGVIAWRDLEVTEC